MTRQDDIYEVALFLAEEHGSCAHALAARIGEIQQRRENPQGVAFWAEVETRIDTILVAPPAY